MASVSVERDMPEHEFIWNAGPQIRPSASVVLVAALAIAGLAHSWAAPAHAREWWGYGLFFVSMAIGQAALSAAVAVWGPRRPILIAAATSSAASIGMWAVSRTLGTPALGPHAGTVEPVGVVDLACKFAEAAAVICSARLWYSTEAPPIIRRRSYASPFAALGLTVVGIAGALGSSVSGHPAPAQIQVASEIYVPPIHQRAAEEAEAEDHEEETEPSSGYEPCIPGEGAPLDLPEDARDGSARIFASSTDRGIEIYLPADDTTSVVVNRRDESCWVTSPQFRGVQGVSFAAEQRIFWTRFSDGATEQLTPDDISIYSHGWDRTGTMLAALAADRSGGPVIYVGDGPADLRPVSKLDLAFFEACGGGDDWESEMLFSPDGSKIMMVETSFLELGSVTVLSPDGDIIKQLDAAHARWIDNETILYATAEKKDQPSRWYVMNLESERQEALAIPSDAHFPEPSPNRSRILYSTMDPAAVFVYDRETDKATKLADGYSAARWLTNSSVIAAGYGPCEECMSSTSDAGKTVKISEGSSEITEAAMGHLSTADQAWSSSAPLPDPTIDPTPSPSPSPSTEPSPSPEPTPSEPTPSPSLEPVPSIEPEPSPSPAGEEPAEG